MKSLPSGCLWNLSKVLHRLHDAYVFRLFSEIYSIIASLAGTHIGAKTMNHCSILSSQHSLMSGSYPFGARQLPTSLGNQSVSLVNLVGFDRCLSIAGA